MASRTGLSETPAMLGAGGRRKSKTTAAGTTNYTYDGDDVVTEAAPGGTFQTLHGPVIDQPLARSGEYFAPNHVGSTSKLTNGAADPTVTASYTYGEPFGQFTVSGSSSNPFIFTGREYDAETDLYYYRSRYYNGWWGRFISEDPVGFAGGLNHYAYCGGNPVNATDPDGQIVNFLVGAGTNVVTGYALARITGQEYTWQNVLTDAGTGAIGVGVLSRASQVLRLSKASQLFFHGGEAWNPALLESGTRHWATVHATLSRVAGAIGGRWNLTARLPGVEARNLSTVTELSGESAAKYSRAYSLNVFSWWKGLRGEYSYQAAGWQRGLQEASEVFASVAGLRTLFEGGRLGVKNCH